MVKALKLIAIAASVSTLAGCVTQNYENAKKPVVQNDTSNKEIAMTRISLGLGYLKMGNTTQAKLNLEKAKRFAPNLVQVYTAFAHYYETVGEDELTVSSYEKALSLKPDDADTLNNYGVYLCRQDRLPEAEKQFLRAIAVPSYLLVSESYENLALCQLRAPNFDKAEMYLSKAIDHNPSNSSSLYQMMRLLYAKGEYPQALAYSRRFEKATRRFNPDSLSLSYKIYAKLGDKRIAKNYGAMLVKMFPDSFQAKQYLLNELAEIEADQLAEKYQLLNLGTLSQPEPKRVVKISPNNKPAIDLYKKRSTAATSSTKRIVQMSPPVDAQTKAAITKPVKKTVVLKSPETKAIEVEEASMPAEEFPNAGSAAEALALAQAELAAIDEQLSAAESGNAVEPEVDNSYTADSASSNNEQEEFLIDPAEQLSAPNEYSDEAQTPISVVETAPIEESETLIDETAQPISAETPVMIDDETVVIVEQGSDEAINNDEDDVDASRELLAKSENKQQVSADVTDNAQEVIATTDSASTLESNELPVQEVTESATGDVQTSELIDQPSVSTEDGELLETQPLQGQNSTAVVVEDTAAALVAALESSEQAPENIEFDVDEHESQQALGEDVNVVGYQQELAEQAPVYMSLDDLPQHVIAEGENLFSVSKRYNIRLNSLIKWNELGERALVKVGDVIYLTDPSVVNQPEE